ncbi:MAG: hypothetical protein CO047_05805, partial [Piscirickettsiaceae bacterium CG_4_9_14_0_2_um_filter_44_546]
QKRVISVNFEHHRFNVVGFDLLVVAKSDRLLGSIGLSHVDVVRPISVAVLTTGNELLMPGEAPQTGKIYNANRGMLHALLQQLGAEIVDLGQVRDSLDETVTAFKKAAEIGDLIMTTGGVSAGEEDHVKAAIDQLGSLQMWKVNMKPGKPIAFGHVNATPLIGLPGNPVSAFVGFNLFAMPILLKMQGVETPLPQPIYMPAGFNREQPARKREFLRGHLTNVVNAGRPLTQIQLYQDQGVGLMRATEWGQGLVDIQVGQTVSVGDLLPFYPLTSLR